MPAKSGRQEGHDSSMKVSQFSQIRNMITITYNSKIRLNCIVPMCQVYVAHRSEGEPGLTWAHVDLRTSAMVSATADC